MSVGAPHCSEAELRRLSALVGDRTLRVPFYVNAGRDVLAEADRRGLLAPLETAGITVIADTCTYITPVIRDADGPVMTNSAKWAWYAPGNLGFEVAFGTLAECVDSAAVGHVVRDDGSWDD